MNWRNGTRFESYKTNLTPDVFLIRDSHNNGEADRNTIDSLFEDSSQVLAMQHRLSNSPLSIAQDLQAQANIDWNQLFNNDKNTNIHFVHGDSDELIPIETVEELVRERPEYHLHSGRE